MNFINSILKQSKPKKCKNCWNEFIPYRTTDKACSIPCAIELGKQKVWEKEKKAIKEKSRTMTEWLNLLQVVFNAYIRLRDAKYGCITCGKPFKEKYDAGHFLSVGSYPNLRFDEDNVHGQCVYCNQHLHSNNAEYFIQLPQRIGLERFNALLEKRNSTLKLTQLEIKQLIEKYKIKIKQLKNNT